MFNGDLLDIARPTLEEVKELNTLLSSLSDKVVYVLGGNHEAVTKDTSTYDYLTLKGVQHSNKVHYLNIDGVTITMVHWDKIHRMGLVKPSDILITHYRSKVEGLYEAEIDDSFVTNYNLVLLGDIHQRYSPHPHVHYTSSPYPIHHIRDSREDFGYVMLTVDAGNYDWKHIDLKLPKKIRLDVEFKDLKDMVLASENLYKVHVTGTIDELSKVKPIQNVAFTKVVKDIAPVTPTVLKDVNFFDQLTTKVNERLAFSTKKTKSVLLKLQGDG